MRWIEVNVFAFYTGCPVKAHAQMGTAILVVSKNLWLLMAKVIGKKMFFQLEEEEGSKLYYSIQEKRSAL